MLFMAVFPIDKERAQRARSISSDTLCGSNCDLARRLSDPVLGVAIAFSSRTAHDDTPSS